MRKDKQLIKIFGEKIYDSIRESKILIIGSGGIGCELMKNLVLIGIKEIHLVDFDTITISNLNRQFLFKNENIGQSKSLVAKKSIESFNYHKCKIVSYHNDIKNSSEFPLNWWKQFEVVFDAVDNIETRRFVNNICLFLKFPLIECGTSGYNGYCQPIFPYFSECFECVKKTIPKTYPICTIRSTPFLPVHCVVWAKESLFYHLFDDNSLDNELSSVNNLKKEVDDINLLNNQINEIEKLKSLRKALINEHFDKFFNDLVKKVFVDDIESLIRLDSLWKTRKKPKPLDFEKYKLQLCSKDNFHDSESENFSELSIWSISDNLKVFYNSCKLLRQKLLSENLNYITFDKDNDIIINIVVSAANIRASIFGIEKKSKFDLKQIVSNIIPSIATTNSIISGFVSLAGINYLKRVFDSKQKSNFSVLTNNSFSTFISMKNNKFVTSALITKPNKNCICTHNVKRGIIDFHTSNLSKLTLRSFIDMLSKQYFYNKNNISLTIDSTKLIYDLDFIENLDKLLLDIGCFKAEKILTVQDEDNKYEILELYLSFFDDKNKCSAIFLPQIKLELKKNAKSVLEDTIQNIPSTDLNVIAVDDCEILSDHKEILVDQKSQRKIRKLDHDHDKFYADYESKKQKTANFDIL